MSITIATIEKRYPRCNGCDQDAEAVARIPVKVSVLDLNLVQRQGIGGLTREESAVASLCLTCLGSAAERLRGYRNPPRE